MKKNSTHGIRAGVILTLCILVGTGAMAATEQDKSQAILDGLAWLSQTQVVSGTEGYWSYAYDGTLATTGAAALAFIEAGFLPGESVVIGEVDYGDVVGRAVTFVFNRATVDGRFAVEYSGFEHYAEDYNFDLDYSNDPGANGQAIYFEPGDSHRRVYTTGICVPVVYALGEALTEVHGPEVLDEPIGIGSPAISGLSYREAMQDLVDWFVWGQVEPNRGTNRGGWRYDANYSTSDNSTAQWGSLPLLYSKSWGLNTPAFVYTELERWVNYIQNGNGGSGYDHPWVYVNMAKTGGLLLELAAIGAPLEDSRVQRAIGFINSRWNTGPSNTWYGNFNHSYAMWAVYKGLENYGLLPTAESFGTDFRVGTGIPAAVGGYTVGDVRDTRISADDDWYSHYCQYLVDIQGSDGRWSGYSYWNGSLATAWYINILSAGGRVPPIGNPAVALFTTFEGDCLRHNDPVRHVAQYWYRNRDGIADPNTVPAEGVVVEIFLSQQLDFVDASGNGEYHEASHSATWAIGTMQVGESGEVWLETTVASTAGASVNLTCSAEVSATNLPDTGWGVDDTEVPVCDDPVSCYWVDSGQITEMGAATGLGWGDYDGDGDQDLLIANLGLNHLYENVDGVLTLVPGWCDDDEPSYGVAWGDYDNDGLADLYVVNSGVPNALYHNEDGVLVRVDAGDAADAGQGYNAAWVDFDKDRDLDLFLCNRNGTSHLFRNDDGVFLTVPGATEIVGTARGCAFADYDNDGDQDLYVSMLGANVLLRNDDGVYVDATAAPLDDNGKGKGVAWGDFDNDQDLDLYLVNTQGENRLFRNDLQGFFTDVTDSLLGNAANGRACAWIDYNHDGWLDLFLTNIAGDNVMFENDRGVFWDNTCEALADAAPLASWGCGFADYDQDGDQDLAMSVNTYTEASYLFNNTMLTGLVQNWLQVDLRGEGSNRSGVGARIIVDTGQLTMVREVSASGTFLSQAPLTASFGTAGATMVDVTVLWPDGTEQTVENVPTNQRVLVVESMGISHVSDLPNLSALAVRNHPNP
ncbi:hypothetical protein DRQ50_06960, partial [bacterium]